MKSTKEQIKNETIEKCKSIFEEFGKISLRELSDLLKIKGFSISYATLYRIEELKFLFQKCILDHEKTKENPLYCNILDYNSNIEKSITNTPLYVAHK